LVCDDLLNGDEDTEPRIQVNVILPARIEAIFVRRDVTLTAEAVSVYEPEASRDANTQIRLRGMKRTVPSPSSPRCAVVLLFLIVGLTIDLGFARADVRSQPDDLGLCGHRRVTGVGRWVPGGV
jgi:hypothetical protein